METRAGAIVRVSTPHPDIMAAPAAAVNSSRLVSCCAIVRPRRNPRLFAFPPPACRATFRAASGKPVGPGDSSPSGRRPWAISPMRSQFSASADRHSPRKRSATPRARLGFAGAHPAQGRQRHAGGLGIRRRFIAERAHRSVIPAAAVAHAPQQEPAAFIDTQPDRRRGPAGHFFFQRQNGQRSRSHPRRRAGDPRPSREFLLGQWRRAQKPHAHAVGAGRFFSGRAQQPVDGARMDRASQLFRRKQGHQRGHPCTFVESGLRRPASVGQLRGAQPVRARGAPVRIRRRPAEPGWRRPSAPSRRFRGRRANHHPDSVCSPLVGSTL